MKPRLLFFQADYKAQLPAFLLSHMREQVRCLSDSFDVTVIHHDCDFQEICDRVEPDLVLFETGPNILTKHCRRPRVANVRDTPTLPRVGFINADAWCETRSGTLSELDYWQAEAVFSICTTAAEHTPVLAERLFVWPNFVDPEVFTDYGEPKQVPVFLTGALAPQYPWRRAVYPLLAQHYPAVAAPHGGYLSRSSGGQLHGPEYARMINRASFVPTCGTVAREVVRKHFEIPASRSCLVTEQAPSLSAAGFVDMENCVFADHHDVLDKVRYLFAHPDALERITEAGYQLVRSRHTIGHRQQIAEWYRLRAAVKPGQRITQDGPFGGLRLVDAAENRFTIHIAGRGRHLEHLAEGNTHLWAGEYERARRCYEETLGYMTALPEARFGLALCDLGSGNAAAARGRLYELLHETLGDYGAPDPDPVELAYYIVALMCAGRVRRARRTAREFPWLRHPVLDRARAAMALFGNGGQVLGPRAAVPRPSIHTCPDWNSDRWCKHVCSMLDACGQRRTAHQLQQANVDGRLPALPVGAPPGGPRTLGSFRRQIVVHKAVRKARRIAARAANIAAAAFG